MEIEVDLSIFSSVVSRPFPSINLLPFTHSLSDFLNIFLASSLPTFSFSTLFFLVYFPCTSSSCVSFPSFCATKCFAFLRNCSFPLYVDLCIFLEIFKCELLCSLSEKIQYDFFRNQSNFYPIFGLDDFVAILSETVIVF